MEKQNTTTKLGFIGGGKLNTSFIERFITDFERKYELTVCTRKKSVPKTQVSENISIEYSTDRWAVEETDGCIFSVRPEQALRALVEYQPYLNEQKFISFVSGLNTQKIYHATGLPLANIVKATGNTNGSYGAAVIYARALSKDTQDFFRDIFSPLVNTGGHMEFVGNGVGSTGILRQVTGIGSWNAIDTRAIELCYENSGRTMSLKEYAKKLLLGERLPSDIEQYLITRERTRKQFNMEACSRHTWISTLTALSINPNPAAIIKTVVTPNGSTERGIKMVNLEALFSKDRLIPIVGRIYGKSKEFPKIIAEEFNKIVLLNHVN